MNWVGWFVTSLVIMAGFWLILRGVPFGSVQQPPAPALFALHTLFPAGVSLFWGIPGATVFGLMALAVVLYALWWRGRTAVPPAALHRDADARVPA